MTHTSPNEQSELPHSTEQAVGAHATEMHVKLVDIAMINRGRKKYERINELAHSLKEEGQLQNLVVRQPREDEIAAGITQPWVLVAGGRRYTAMLLLEWETARCVEAKNLEPWRARALELQENLQREDMTWQEQVDMRREIHDLYKGQNPEWRQEDTARILRESVTTVSRDLKLAKAMQKDPSLKKATSKKTAVRQAAIKETLRAREVASKSVDLSPLRERLQTADARDFLRGQSTGSVDLLFTDLPWGIDYHSRPGGGGVSEYDDSRDTTSALIRDIVPDMLRVTKPTGWIVVVMNWELHFELKTMLELCCVEHFDYTFLDFKEDVWRCNHGTKESPCRRLKCEDIPWIWYRPNSRNNPQRPELHAQNQYELILVLNRGEGKILLQGQERVGNVLMYDADYSNRIHAMQKPDALCEDIIRRLTAPGEKVVDPCFGSGAVLRAACKTGRKFEGCDLNPDMLDLAIAYVGEVFGGTTKKEPAA